MPTRFRPGTGQLGITGIPTEMIKEFKRLCKGAGQNGRDLSYGELFEKVFEEWKASKSNRGRKILDVAGLPTEQELQAWLRSRKLAREDIEEILPLLKQVSRG